MTAQTGVSPDILPLPVGGGGVSSIGEVFNTDLYTGTGSYAVPLWFPAGPGGFTPELSLNYSTTAGNGPFGMGWQLSVLKLWRQTDRGVPQYDGNDSLIFAGEEIVRMADGSYRARQERRFNRIEVRNDGFIVQDRGGKMFELGLLASAREELSVSGKTMTSAWMLEKATDTNGNSIHYQWFRDQGRLYLHSICYGPYEIRFLYSPREDIQYNARTGYMITTTLRCSTIEYRLLTRDNLLFRHYDLEYRQDDHSRLSLLNRIDVAGEQMEEEGITTAELPSLQFGYQLFEFKPDYQPYKTNTGVAQPPAQQNVNANLVDWQAQGLPGVIEVDGPQRRFWPSLTQGQFGRPRCIDHLPDGLNLADQPVVFADMDGTGTADVVMLAESPLGYLRNEAGKGWGSRRQPFRQAPAFDVNDANVRMVDLNGDGRVDVIRSSQHCFYIYLNEQDGWSEPVSVPRIHDMAQFPDLFFSDPRVRFADMSGDGLMDLVWIHGSRIDYWPGLGNGRFAHRRHLGITPCITRGFDVAGLFLADINGNGVSDVIYVEHNQVKVWVNQSGNALSYAGVVAHTPLTDGQSVRIADMEGRGVAGLLWSYPPGQVAGGNYKYLTFSGEHKPYLMNRIENGMGLTTVIHYQSAAQQAQQALIEHQAWDSHLPFALQTVSCVEDIDIISGAHTQRSMRYRNGLFDGHRRQFLGFEQVNVIEWGDSDTPSSETISWFHQGRSGLPDSATAQERLALAGRLFRVEIWDLGRVNISTDTPRLMRQEQNEYQVKQLALSADNTPVLFACLGENQVDNLEGQAIGAAVKTAFDYDHAGNITRREEQWDNGTGTQIRKGEFSYSAQLNTNAVINLPLEYREYNAAGQLVRLRRYYYDGPEFVGLPFGQVAQGNLSRVELLVFTQDLFDSIYSGLGLNAADMGYHAINLPDGTQGWATNLLRQRHNGQGNPIARKDAYGHVGTIGYDPQGIAPVAITDPTGLHYQGSYDYRAARLSQVTDPNGQSTYYQFDPMGRLKAVVKPGDSPGYPTQMMTYQSKLFPVSTLTQSRPAAGVPVTVDSVEYVDGKGQVVQRRSQVEDGRVLVDGRRVYNCRGWESRRSIPFFSSGMDYIPDEGVAVAQQFRFQYDGLGRITATLTPDGYQSKTEYAPAQVTRFDVTDMDDSAENIARGHFDTPRVESIDAKGNLVAVTEMNADRSTVRTVYELDPMGQLLSITDPRGGKNG